MLLDIICPSVLGDDDCCKESTVALLNVASGDSRDSFIRYDVEDVCNTEASPIFVEFKVEILDFSICVVLLPNDGLLVEVNVLSVVEIDAAVVR